MRAAAVLSFALLLLALVRAQDEDQQQQGENVDGLYKFEIVDGMVVATPPEKRDPPEQSDEFSEEGKKWAEKLSALGLDINGNAEGNNEGNNQGNNEENNDGNNEENNDGDNEGNADDNNVDGA